jgi:hypothetical protein
VVVVLLEPTRRSAQIVETSGILLAARLLMLVLFALGPCAQRVADPNADAKPALREYTVHRNAMLSVEV